MKYRKIKKASLRFGDFKSQKGETWILSSVFLFYFWFLNSQLLTYFNTSSIMILNFKYRNKNENEIWGINMTKKIETEQRYLQNPFKNEVIVQTVKGTRTIFASPTKENRFAMISRETGEDNGDITFGKRIN